ncbi:arrestin domain-containing protein 5-like [Manduca sexta]|uniref:arrestin domain-containing protein 5-like n=1 Tax=Manduca sexta TaxID=7130 RepID=UPI0018902870|nr:arrestin domain-containing protein 5-like [Manduca sexta]
MGVACQILIDRPSEGVHRPGGPVSGVIKYAVDVPTKYEHATISLMGQAYCSWHETEDDNSRTRYTGTDIVICKVDSLLPRYTDTLPIGAYEYRFVYTLPHDIPSSFQHAWGHINYAIILEFKKQAVLTLTKVFKQYIVVRSYLDHVRPIPDTPITFQMEKTLFKPLSSGNQKINLKARIAKPSVKPGERVDIKLIINNDTSVNIKSIKAELVRKTVFTADCWKSRVAEETVEQCGGETVGVSANSVANMTISVPIVTWECTIQNSKVINNVYEILMTIRLPMPHCNAKVSVPILLGERERDLPPVEQGIDIARLMDEHTLPPPYREIEA